MMIAEDVLKRHVSARLKERRVELGIQQEYLATATGLNRTTIANIETNRQGVPLHLLYVLCSALDMQVASVLPPMEAIITNEHDVPTGSIEGINIPLAPKTMGMIRHLLGDGEEFTPSLNASLFPQASGLLNHLKKD